MLIKHIRDSKREPFGTIVANKVDGEIHIGISICCDKDQFNKKMGKKIAEGRLLTGSPLYIPNRTIDGFPIEEFLDNEIIRMRNRAKSYFKAGLDNEIICMKNRAKSYFKAGVV